MKFEPCPFLDLQMMSPSNILIIFFVMWRPRPIPYVFICFVDSRKPNNLNSFGMSSIPIPIPVSFTYISKKVKCSLAYIARSRSGSLTEKSFLECILLALTSILPPHGVNLIAFETKFKRIWCNLCSSNLIMQLLFYTFA